MLHAGGGGVEARQDGAPGRTALRVRVVRPQNKASTTNTTTTTTTTTTNTSTTAASGGAAAGGHRRECGRGEGDVGAAARVVAGGRGSEGRTSLLSRLSSLGAFVPRSYIP